ncbi:hypothetical protein CR513_54952, partial [Mucuna pruriens]
MEMEETAGGSNSDGGAQWWWGVASAAQMGLGMRTYAKGYAGDSRLMPFKAFAVASLFLGSAASASVLLLQANGIHRVLLSLPFHFLIDLLLKVFQHYVDTMCCTRYPKQPFSFCHQHLTWDFVVCRIICHNLDNIVEDLIEAGANLRAKLGLPPRTQNKYAY